MNELIFGPPSPLVPQLVSGQPGRHNAMVLSQLWPLNHLSPEGDQPATRWDPLLKCPVPLGCLHTARGRFSPLCVFLFVCFVWGVK